MADEIHEFTVTVPAGTPVATPITFNLAMPPRIVESVDIRIPPGPRGEVGFQLGASGLAVIPYEPGSFIVGDGETISWPLERQIDSGAWQLIAYNTGSFNHKLYISFKTHLVPNPADVAAGWHPIASATLSAPAAPLTARPV